MTENEAREAVKALDRLPRHIAVIMDGNGRWAQQHDLPRERGHLAGRAATKRLVAACGDVGIEALTVYSFSAENWSRPDREVRALMTLIETSLKDEIDELHARDIRFMASGRLHELPPSLQETVRRSTERTAANTGLVLNVAINYGGRTELVDVCRTLAARAAEGKLDPAGIDEDAIRAELYAPDLPDPDLIIRTGGDMRISNFLIWQAAYAEFYVLPIFWPDFRDEHLFEALLAYAERDRRFGRVKPSL